MWRNWFRKYEALPDLLPADAFYAPIHAFTDDRLREQGFVRLARGRWVKEQCQSGRPMIELRHFKGAVSAPYWGYSLSYVPHFDNACRKLSWHRTLKTAKLDTFPFDEIDRVESINRFALPHDHAATVERVLGGALDDAAAFFDRYRTTADLIPLFERLKRDRKSAIDYWSCTQIPLAHAFTLGVTGQREPGLQILERYSERMRLSQAARAALLSRFEQADAEPDLS